MKIYKYIAIGAVATFAWSAAQAESETINEGFSMSGGGNYSENEGSEHVGSNSETWDDTNAGGGFRADGYRTVTKKS